MLSLRVGHFRSNEHIKLSNFRYEYVNTCSRVTSCWPYNLLDLSIEFLSASVPFHVEIIIGHDIHNDRFLHCETLTYARSKCSRTAKGRNIRKEHRSVYVPNVPINELESMLFPPNVYVWGPIQRCCEPLKGKGGCNLWNIEENHIFSTLKHTKKTIFISSLMSWQVPIL